MTYNSNNTETIPKSVLGEISNKSRKTSKSKQKMPDEYLENFKQAESLYSGKNYVDAIKILNFIAENISSQTNSINPNINKSISPEISQFCLQKIYFLTGCCFNQCLMYREAINCFEKVISHDPKNKIAHFNKATCYSNLKMYSEAIESYNAVIHLDEKSKDAIINMATCFKNLKNFEEGLAAYENALVLDPKCKEALLGKADCLQEMGKGEEALCLIDNLIASKENEKENIEENAKDIEKIIRKSNLLKANVLEKLNKEEEALTIYENILQSDDKCKVALLKKGNILLNSINTVENNEVEDKYKKNEDALILIEKALEIDNKYKEGYFRKAEILRNMKRYDESLVFFQKVIEIDCNHKDAYLMICLSLLDKYEIESVTYKENKNSNIKIYLEKAFEIYNYLFSIDKDDMFVLLNKGLLLLIMEEFEKSGTEFSLFENTFNNQNINYKLYITEEIKNYITFFILKIIINIQKLNELTKSLANSVLKENTKYHSEKNIEENNIEQNENKIILDEKEQTNIKKEKAQKDILEKKDIHNQIKIISHIDDLKEYLNVNSKLFINQLYLLKYNKKFSDNFKNYFIDNNQKFNDKPKKSTLVINSDNSFISSIVQNDGNNDPSQKQIENTEVFEKAKATKINEKFDAENKMIYDSTRKNNYFHFNEIENIINKVDNITCLFKKNVIEYNFEKSLIQEKIISHFKLKEKIENIIKTFRKNIEELLENYNKQNDDIFSSSIDNKNNESKNVFYNTNKAGIYFNKTCPMINKENTVNNLRNEDGFNISNFNPLDDSNNIYQKEYNGSLTYINGDIKNKLLNYFDTIMSKFENYILGLEIIEKKLYTINYHNYIEASTLNNYYASETKKEIVCSFFDSISLNFFDNLKEKDELLFKDFTENIIMIKKATKIIKIKPNIDLFFNSLYIILYNLLLNERKISEISNFRLVIKDNLVARKENNKFNFLIDFYKREKKHLEKIDLIFTNYFSDYKESYVNIKSEDLIADFDFKKIVRTFLEENSNISNGYNSFEQKFIELMLKDFDYDQQTTIYDSYIACKGCCVSKTCLIL